MSNTTNNNETMAQIHTRLYRTAPMSTFLRVCVDDWKSGDMTLSRMESVIGCDCYIVKRLKGYNKFIGKLERVGRLGKSGSNLNVCMGRITPNEIHAYLLYLIVFLRENGWDGMTADELAAMVGPI